MTCIVAIKDHVRGSVIMGGDSAGVCSDHSIIIRKDPKVFKIGEEFIIGFTSSFRMGQLLMFNLKTPKHPKGISTYKYMVSLFVESVRDCFEKGGYTTTTEEGEERGGVFLVGYRGRIFEIAMDFQVAESVDDYVSVGCGDYFALGSLYATDEEEGMSPLQRLEKALDAATYFSGGVAQPYTILELDKE